MKYIALSILLNLSVFAFSQENTNIGFSINSGITFSIPLQNEATQFYTDVNINGSERTKYYPSHGNFIDLLVNKSLASIILLVLDSIIVYIQSGFMILVLKENKKEI